MTAELIVNPGDAIYARRVGRREAHWYVIDEAEYTPGRPGLRALAHRKDSGSVRPTRMAFDRVIRIERAQR